MESSDQKAPHRKVAKTNVGCRRVKGKLSSLLSSELPESEVKTIKNHLRVCGNCTHEYEALLKTCVLLKNCKNREPSPDFRERLHRKISQRKERRVVGAPLLRSLKWSLRSNLPLSPQKIMVNAASLILLILFIMSQNISWGVEKPVWAWGKKRIKPPLKSSNVTISCHFFHIGFGEEGGEIILRVKVGS